MTNIAQGSLDQVKMGQSSIFVVLSFLFFSNAAARSLVLSNEDDLALERELMILNKPYVKSFKVILIST